MATRDPRTGRPTRSRRRTPPEPAPVLAGAEAFSSEGGRVGVLLLHGFTGSPQGVRPWALGLAEAGLSVAVPRLPGHGTTVQDLDRSTWRDWYSLARADLHTLRRRCDVVVVGGLSMGGALALRLAVHEPEAVDGVALVNPAVLLGDPRLAALPLLRRLRRSIPGVGGDIARAGAQEEAYDRVPLRGLASFVDLMAQVRTELPQLHQPLVVLHSPSDHVIPPSSSRAVLSGAGSGEVREVLLERSFHVATHDHDLPLVVEETLRLARSLGALPETATPAAPPGRDGHRPVLASVAS